MLYYRPSNYVHSLCVSVVDIGATSTMLMGAALKSNTKRTYSSAQSRYLTFCERFNLVTMPCTEDTLLLYVGFLFEEGLTGSSIRVYLSAVRSLHIFAGEHYPTELLRVKLALRGAVRRTPQPIRKLPITVNILRSLLYHARFRFDKILIEAVITLAFFGCFRLGELCVPDSADFDRSIHLCLGDVTISHGDKTLVVFLKRSKTDTTDAGVSVYVGCSGEATCCAFCSMVAYLEFRRTLSVGHSSGAPLFVVHGGSPLHKAYLISVLRILLSLSGYNPALYSGHSFRAGAATTAGDSDFRDWELKMLGRWASTAYNIYLRNPKLTATFARRLVSGD